jgi:hypothetical protein
MVVLVMAPAAGGRMVWLRRRVRGTGRLSPTLVGGICAVVGVVAGLVGSGLGWHLVLLAFWSVAVIAVRMAVIDLRVLGVGAGFTRSARARRDDGGESDRRERWRGWAGRT